MRPIQTVDHGSVKLLTISFRNGKQGKAAQSVMFKKIGGLRQCG
jgi:hypothetical protein